MGNNFVRVQRNFGRCKQLSLIWHILAINYVIRGTSYAAFRVAWTIVFAFLICAGFGCSDMFGVREIVYQKKPSPDGKMFAEINYIDGGALSDTHTRVNLGYTQIGKDERVLDVAGVPLVYADWLDRDSLRLEVIGRGLKAEDVDREVHVTDRHRIDVVYIRDYIVDIVDHVESPDGDFIAMVWRLRSAKPTSEKWKSCTVFAVQGNSGKSQELCGEVGQSGWLNIWGDAKIDIAWIDSHTVKASIPKNTEKNVYSRQDRPVFFNSGPPVKLEFEVSQ